MENNNKSNDPMKRLAKVALYYAVFMLLLVALSFFKSFFPAKFEKLSFGVLGLIAAFTATVLFLKKDKKTFADIGLSYQNTTFRKFITGALLGIVLMGCASMLVVLLSGFRIEANENSSFSHFILWTLPLIPLAAMEEIPARGYALTSLKERFSIRLAIILTSLLFACSHIAYGWSIVDSLLGPGIMGIIFGTLALYADGIAMPLGAHYGFNLVTAAFAANDQSFNLWVLKDSSGQSLENYQQSLTATLLPNVFFLIVGLIMMEIYIRKNKNC